MSHCSACEDAQQPARGGEEHATVVESKLQLVDPEEWWWGQQAVPAVADEPQWAPGIRSPFVCEPGSVDGAKQAYVGMASVESADDDRRGAVEVDHVWQQGHANERRSILSAVPRRTGARLRGPGRIRAECERDDGDQQRCLCDHPTSVFDHPATVPASPACELPGRHVDRRCGNPPHLRRSDATSAAGGGWVRGGWLDSPPDVRLVAP